MASGKVPEFKTLKECLEFLQWLHRDRNMQGLVGHRLEKLLQKRYDSVSASLIANELTQFLGHVSRFHTKLCKSPQGVYNGQETAKHVTNALLDCVPKLLSAIYFLRYKVDDGFEALGGGGWAGEMVGQVARYARIYTQSDQYMKHATNIDKYLIAKKDDQYAVIPGGFEPSDLKEGYRVSRSEGYNPGSAMVKDLMDICEKHAGKDKHNYFLDVYSTTVLSTSGSHTSNVANALRLVHDFCGIFAEVEQNDFQNHLYMKDRCFDLPQLKEHCKKLKGPLSNLFSDKAFSFTGYAREYKKLKKQDIAKKMASWFKKHLIAVKEKLVNIKTLSNTKNFNINTLRKGKGLNKNQSNELADYLSNNFVPYGFTFFANRYETKTTPYGELFTNWNGAIQMLKTPGGGLGRLVDILNGTSCPKQESVKDEEAEEEPEDMELVNGEMVPVSRTIESPPAAKVPEAPKKVVTDKKSEGAQNQGKKAEAGKTVGQSEATPSGSPVAKVSQIQDTRATNSQSGSSGATGSNRGQTASSGVGQQNGQEPQEARYGASGTATTALGSGAGGGGDGGDGSSSGGNVKNKISPQLRKRMDEYYEEQNKIKRHRQMKLGRITNPLKEKLHNVWQDMQEKNIRETFRSKNPPNIQIDEAYSMPTQPTRHYHTQPDGHHSSVSLPKATNPQMIDGSQQPDSLLVKQEPWWFNEPAYSEISGMPVKIHETLGREEKKMEDLYNRKLDDHLNAQIEKNIFMTKWHDNEKEKIAQYKEDAENKHVDTVNKRNSNMHILALPIPSTDPLSLQKEIIVPPMPSMGDIIGAAIPDPKLNSRMSQIIPIQFDPAPPHPPIDISFKSATPRLEKAFDQAFQFDIKPVIRLPPDTDVPHIPSRYPTVLFAPHLYLETMKPSEPFQASVIEMDPFMDDSNVEITQPSRKVNLDPTAENIYGKNQYDVDLQIDVAQRPFQDSLHDINIDDPNAKTADILRDELKTSVHKYGEDKGFAGVPQINFSVDFVPDRLDLKDYEYPGIPRDSPRKEDERIIPLIPDIDSIRRARELSTPHMDIDVAKKTWPNSDFRPEELYFDFKQSDPYYSLGLPPKHTEILIEHQDFKASNEAENLKLEVDEGSLTDFSIHVADRTLNESSYDLNIDDPPPPPNIQPLDPITPTTPAINLTFPPILVPQIPTPEDFDKKTIKQPDIELCLASWAIPTSTHGSTGVPETELFPAEAPRTVREMLTWMAGLKHEKHHDTLEKCINKAFSGPHSDPKQLAFSVNGTYITPKAVIDILQLTAMFAGSVLTAIAPKWRENASSKTVQPRSSEEPDCCALLCQLRDYAYACHHQLQFLKSQCNRDKSHGGWKNDEYGSDIKTSSPLQAFLTGGWDSTFKTHPFDPCNLCLKSRIKMGFRVKDLPEKSQLGSVISTILTPSCGGEDPLLTLASYLNCLTRRTPRTTGELVSFFHHFGMELHGSDPNELNSLSIQRDLMSNSLHDVATALRCGLAGLLSCRLPVGRLRHPT